MIKMSPIKSCIINKNLVMHVLGLVPSGGLVLTCTGTGDMQTRVLLYFFNDEDTCWLNL